MWHLVWVSNWHTSNAHKPTTQPENRDLTKTLANSWGPSSSHSYSPLRDHHLEFCTFSSPDRIEFYHMYLSHQTTNGFVLLIFWAWGVSICCLSSVFNLWGSSAGLILCITVFSILPTAQPVPSLGKHNGGPAVHHATGGRPGPCHSQVHILVVALTADPHLAMSQLFPLFWGASSTFPQNGLERLSGPISEALPILLFSQEQTRPLRPSHAASRKSPSGMLEWVEWHGHGIHCTG